MANIKSAKKRAKQAVVRNARNASQRSMLRTAVKKVLKALGENDATGAETAFATAQPILDRMSARGLIHKNKAARHKSRLTARIKAIKAACSAHAGLRAATANHRRNEKPGSGRVFRRLSYPDPEHGLSAPRRALRVRPPAAGPGTPSPRA